MLKLVYYFVVSLYMPVVSAVITLDNNNNPVHALNNINIAASIEMSPKPCLPVD